MATKTSTTRHATAPARKATKAKAPKKAKARAKALPSRAKDDFANDMTIAVLAKKNPHLTGTKAHDRFGLYKKGMTVGGVLAAMK